MLALWIRKPFGRRTTRKPHPSSRPILRVEALEDRTVPSTLTVTTVADNGPGSLRADIVAAQDGDTIVFDPSLAGQTIYLTSGELAITTNLTIEGTPSWNPPAINALENSRVIDVASSASLAIDNLLIEGGSAKKGGGLYNAGAVTLSDCSFHFNSATDGGAIENNGTMTVTNCDLSYDVALHNGGAIDNKGDLTVGGVWGCGFAADSANSAGGAISNFGTMNLVNSSFYRTFSSKGGAVANFGNATLGNCAIVDCGADDGGGILNQANMTVAGSYFSGGAERGGGIYNSGNLVLSRSVLVSNAASVAGGGIYNSGTLVVDACTINGNVAVANGGGGVFNAGTLTVSNSFFCLNSPEDIFGTYIDGGGNTFC